MDIAHTTADPDSIGEVQTDPDILLFKHLQLGLTASLMCLSCFGNLLTIFAVINEYTSTKEEERVNCQFGCVRYDMSYYTYDNSTASSTWQIHTISYIPIDFAEFNFCVYHHLSYGCHRLGTHHSNHTPTALSYDGDR